MLPVLPLLVLFASADPKPAAPTSSTAKAVRPGEDFDHDGIPDIDDDCPTDPGDAKNKGCPPNMKKEVKPKPTNIVVKDDRIDIKDTVLFRTASASVDPKSFGLLKAIAASITAVPAAKKIIVVGHTDD